MYGYELLKKHNKQILDNGLFSTPCVLTDKTGKKYGVKDIKSELKCFAPFIGMTLSLDEMTQVIGDSCEATLNIGSIQVIPQEGWTIEIYYPHLTAWLQFDIKSIATDRMLGWYYFKLSMQKPQGQSKVIERMRIGGY